MAAEMFLPSDSSDCSLCVHRVVFSLRLRSRSAIKKALEAYRRSDKYSNFFLVISVGLPDVQNEIIAEDAGTISQRTSRRESANREDHFFAVLALFSFAVFA